MSVFILNSEDFASIAATLRAKRDGFQRPFFPLSMEERWEYVALVQPIKKETEEEYTLSLIEPFVVRLYLANVLSERYTYMKEGMTEFVVPLIDLPPGRVLSLHDLLRTLGSLSYNLVTNGGNSFLGVKDDEKLDRLRSAIKDEIIRA